MKPKEYIKFYLEWIVFTILMLINIAILIVLGTATLLATFIRREKFYRSAISCILMGIRGEAKKLM